jgi:hypothetical protein
MSFPIIYSTNKLIIQYSSTELYTFKLWKPTLCNAYPPNKSKKYLFYYLFHLLGIFKNKNYCAVLVYHDELLIASLLIVPKYFKWPFMGSNDVQFTYVLTKKEYRGQGLASKMLVFGYENLKSRINNYWYVTTEDNLISQNVAIKCGFLKSGIGVRHQFTLGLKTQF